MNLNAYGYGPADDRKWIIVDIGVTFGREELTPGVELILPDPSYLEGERDNILGIVLTHAHEDHIGALGWLWPRLKAPVYATPFTAALLREKLQRARAAGESPAHGNSAEGKAHAWAVRHRFRHAHALDPRAQRPRHSHAARSRLAHRRLENRSRSADRRNHG